VRTNIGKSSRNRPSHLAGGGLADIDISLEHNPAYRWISAEGTRAVVVRAIKNGDLYAITHPRLVRHGRAAPPDHRCRVPPGRQPIMKQPGKAAQ